MSVGRLNGNKKNPRVNKVLITAKLSGLSIDWDESFKFGVHNKSGEYLAKFPLGQVPTFETKDGLFLAESSAISFYLANLKDNNPLLGRNKDELAKIYQYSFFIETQYMPYLTTILSPAFGLTVYNPVAEKNAYVKLDNILFHLENDINSKSFLVGESLTLADILVGENLAFSLTLILDEAYRKRFPNLTRYFKNYRGLAEIKEVIGETKLCETPLQPRI